MSNALVAQPGSAIFVIRLIGEKALDGIRTRDLYLIGGQSNKKLLLDLYLTKVTLYQAELPRQLDEQSSQ